jgi:hypothetical protein
MVQLNHQVQALLNITPKEETPTFADLGKSFKSITQTLAENVYTASYLADEGFSSSEVTGLNYTVTFSGDYKKNDPVIQFLFSPDVLHGVGEARKTQLKLVKDGKIALWNVTMTKITESGGEANAPNSITLELKGNGKPSIITE